MAAARRAGHPQKATNRWSLAPHRRIRYALKPLTLIDLFSFLPFFIPFVSVDLRFIRSVRQIRMFRVLKYVDHGGVWGCLPKNAAGEDAWGVHRHAGRRPVCAARGHYRLGVCGGDPAQLEKPFPMSNFMKWIMKIDAKWRKLC